MDPNDILRKYLSLGEGETVESWQSGEPMKAIKMMIRTKSGRLVEKTIFVSADDYDRMMREGGDPNSILRKYLDPNEGTIESWEKVPEPGMKVSVEEERINLQVSSSVKCLIHRLVMSSRGGGRGGRQLKDARRVKICSTSGTSVMFIFGWNTFVGSNVIHSACFVGK